MNPGDADESTRKPPRVDPRGTTRVDSVSNLRLLSDVQQRGLDAANSVIEKLTALTNTTAESASVLESADSISRLARDLSASFSAALATLVANGQGPRVSGSPTDRTLKTDAEPGERAEIAVWFHNYTDAPAEAVVMHPGDLVTTDGRRIGAEHIEVPNEPFDLACGASHGTKIAVNVPATATGVYRGILVASPSQELWSTIEVEVHRA